MRRKRVCIFHITERQRHCTEHPQGERHAGIQHGQDPSSLLHRKKMVFSAGDFFQHSKRQNSCRFCTGHACRFLFFRESNEVLLYGLDQLQCLLEFFSGRCFHKLFQHKLFCMVLQIRIHYDSPTVLSNRADRALVLLTSAPRSCFCESSSVR